MNRQVSDWELVSCPLEEEDLPDDEKFAKKQKKGFWLVFAVSVDEFILDFPSVF